MRNHPATPLKTLLVNEGRKQSWVAERTGIAPSTINQIAHGLRPTAPQAQAIADLLGRDVIELWPTVEAAA
jgi:transcriptional regulator with XRE-family HTH domain